MISEVPASFLYRHRYEIVPTLHTVQQVDFPNLFDLFRRNVVDEQLDWQATGAQMTRSEGSFEHKHVFGVRGVTDKRSGITFVIGDL